MSSGDNSNSDRNQEVKTLLCELPFYNAAYIPNLYQFSDNLTQILPSKKELDKYPSMCDLDLFNTEINSNINPDVNSPYQPMRTHYYSPHKFAEFKKSLSKTNMDTSFSLLHNNVRSLKRNLEKFQVHLLDELNFNFSVIGITETKITDENFFEFNPEIPNYKFEFVPTPLASGGVGMYIDKNLKYTIIEKNSNKAFQALWIEIQFTKKPNLICGVIYRQHNSPECFQTYFEEILDKFNSSFPNKPIYIMGDFNINLLKTQTCKYAQNFLLTLQSYALLPTIDKPTRVYKNSATLIDIFTNKVDEKISSGNIISDISDHFSQFCIIRSSKQKFVHQHKIRDYSHFSNTKFTNELSQIDWESIIAKKKDKVDNLFSTFYNKLNKLTNKHAPFKTISKRKAKQFSKPWITKGLRKSIKAKIYFFHSGDTDKYKLYRNKIQTLTRISKKLYFHTYFENNIKNMKKTWEGINDLINHKKRNQKHITAIKCQNNDITQNTSEISNILNKYFSTVGQKLASSLSNSTKHFSDYLSADHRAHSFFFNPVTSLEVEYEITSMPINKAHGLYSCPTRILKCAKQFISKPLGEILNLSILGGVYPSKLKHAKVIPIFKNGDETESGNYRPISLLSNFNRIFEKLIYKRIKSFFEENFVLFKSQFGFREKHSTQHAILDIVNNIQDNMDKKMFSCGIFIDLKKAFDTVDHTILLRKLNHYGIRGSINNWFNSYLTGRTQTTQIGMEISNKEENTYGVPQGSVLGPLLFLIYINDIHKCSDVFKFCLFADDTNLLYADKELKSLETVVNRELLSVCEWLSANKLTLNAKKSNFVIFHSFKKKLNYQVNIKMLDSSSNELISIEHKEYVKYLGVLIDENLTWKCHIDNIASKISKAIGVISRMRHFVPSSTLHNIYQSLILPYLTYGIVIWGQATQANQNKILLLQKRALRLIYFKRKSEHAIPLFVCSKIMPLNMLYYSAVSNLMYDISNNTTPSTISDLFIYSKEVHAHNTRHAASYNFYINYSRMNQKKLSFAKLGAKIWNSICPEIRKLEKKTFNKIIKKSLLTVLEVEDDYVNTPTTIQLMTKQLTSIKI